MRVIVASFFIGLLFAMTVLLMGYIFVKNHVNTLDTKINDNYVKVSTNMTAGDANQIQSINLRMDALNRNVENIARTTQYIRTDNGKTIIDGTDLCINNTCLNSSTSTLENVAVDTLNARLEQIPRDLNVEIQDLRQFDQSIETRYAAIDDSMTALLGRYATFEDRVDDIEARLPAP